MNARRLTASCDPFPLLIKVRWLLLHETHSPEPRTLSIVLPWRVQVGVRRPRLDVQVGAACTSLDRSTPSRPIRSFRCYPHPTLDYPPRSIDPPLTDLSSSHAGIMTGQNSGSTGRRREGGVWAPRLSRTQRRNLLTALVISLSFLVCLQVCLLLILVRQENPGGEDDRLVAISQSNVAPEVTSPWAAFHRLPRVCARCCRLLRF